MQRARDPILWVGAIVVLAAGLHGLIASTAWVGQPFAGFLLLENRVVPSAGLAHWPAVQGGELFQSELVSVDGQRLGHANELPPLLRSQPIGTGFLYRFESPEGPVHQVIETRLFKRSDWILLFGSFLFCGLGLACVGLTIRYLRPNDPAADGGALSLWIIGMWALTAMDLYGPYQLFRAHAFFECLIFAGTFHLALVFPSPRRLVRDSPWLPWALYGVAAALGVWGQLGLHEPRVYVQMHRIAMTAFGAAALTLIACQVWTFLRPPSFEARQRVKVLALGAVGALTPQVVLSLSSAASGGQAPENLMGWSGIFFPISVAYAVLRSDMLQVDALLRRTLSYAVLTGIVAVSYAAIIVGIEPLFRGEGSRWIPALALAGFSALILLPLRDRIQSAVDRVFFRNSYDFRRIVAESSARLAAVTELPVVTHYLERVVGDTLMPESLEFELLNPVPPESSPARVERRRVRGRDDGGLDVMFVAERQIVAMMRLGRPLSGRFYSGDDRRFLATLANQGAVAIQNALALRDLAELNQTLEEKVEERTSELLRALHELKETQRQMVHQEKMASVGQLVAGVAHEINNPLNFIEGNLFHLHEYTDALRKVIEGYEAATVEARSEVRERMAAIREDAELSYILEDLDGVIGGCEEGVRRTTTIVRDLRTFSRMDSGEVVGVDIPAALDATLNLLRGRLTGIEVQRDYQPLPPVECLEGQINQVFMNLIANAADAMGDRGTLRVRVGQQDPDHVDVEVEDEGCGIGAQDLERIFEPFFTTKAVGRGTGLGLAISYGVIARHGGRIDVDSVPGEGTRFRVRLPLTFTKQETGDRS